MNFCILLLYLYVVNGKNKWMKWKKKERRPCPGWYFTIVTGVVFFTVAVSNYIVTLNLWCYHFICLMTLFLGHNSCHSLPIFIAYFLLPVIFYTLYMYTIPVFEIPFLDHRCPNHWLQISLCKCKQRKAGKHNWEYPLSCSFYLGYFFVHHTCTKLSV